MTTQDYNELAGKLIEYDLELTQREIIATRKNDFKKLEELAKIKNDIGELLEVLDKEH